MSNMISNKASIFNTSPQYVPNSTSLCVLFILSCLLSMSASAKEKIHWAKYEIKPLFLMQEENANTGMGDELLALIQRSLPQYEHQNYTTVMARILRDLQDTKTLTCSGMLPRKLPADKVLSSLPVLQLPNHSLQFHHSRLAEIEQLIGQPFNKPMSLEALITSKPEIKISITKHRSYGKKINHIIKQYPANFIVYPAQLNIVDHIKLTEKRRVAFTLEYPFVSVYAFQNDAQQPYRSTKLLESQEHLLAYILCTNTQVGRQVIADLNQFIKSNWLTSSYRRIAERWLPHSSIALYRLQYEKIRDKYQ